MEDVMTAGISRIIAPAIATIGILGLGSMPLQAQRRGSNWPARCEANVYGRHARAKFCEEREFGMKPGAGMLTIDGGQNGGVDVIGWDKDSIHVVALVEANAD